jgi:hypothetical protein
MLKQKESLATTISGVLVVLFGLGLIVFVLWMIFA